MGGMGEGPGRQIFDCEGTGSVGCGLNIRRGEGGGGRGAQIKMVIYFYL